MYGTKAGIRSRRLHFVASILMPPFFQLLDPLSIRDSEPPPTLLDHILYWPPNSGFGFIFTILYFLRVILILLTILYVIKMPFSCCPQCPRKFIGDNPCSLSKHQGSCSAYEQYLTWARQLQWTVIESNTKRRTQLKERKNWIASHQIALQAESPPHPSPCCSFTPPNHPTLLPQPDTLVDVKMLTIPSTPPPAPPTPLPPPDHIT